MTLLPVLVPGTHGSLAGDRRTTWLARLGETPAGMASRNRGIGSALLAAIVARAEERRYVRLVTSPSARRA